MRDERASEMGTLTGATHGYRQAMQELGREARTPDEACNVARRRLGLWCSFAS